MLKPIIIFITLLLIILNFGLQSFDIYSFTFNKCGFYVLDLNCMNPFMFITNKILRFHINLVCLFVPVYYFTRSAYAVILPMSIILFLLLGIDLYLALSRQPFLVQFHKVLNPVLYSPLLPVVYLGSRFLNKAS